MKLFRRKGSPRPKPIHVCHVSVVAVVRKGVISIKTTVTDRTGALWEQWEDSSGTAGPWVEKPRPAK